VANETHERLAELALERKKFRTARRHLTAALLLQPNDSRLHYRLAMSHVEAEDGDLETAAKHFRKSLKIDPQQPECLRAFGLLHLRQGEVDEGLRCLYQAVELAPSDVETLQCLVDALEEHGKNEEAQRALRNALFLNSGAADFRRMWDDYRFREVWRNQVQERRRLTHRGGRAVLPFVQVARKSVRRDAPSLVTGPHRTRTSHISSRQI
jgi:Flp pilus assembly protein TadD